MTVVPSGYFTYDPAR